MTLCEKNCCVCRKMNSSYKCPTCKLPYCSVSCYKTHKTVPCIVQNAESDSVEKDNEKVREYEFPTEDTVPIQKLEELSKSDEVRNCLRNRHVKDMIKGILKSEDPTDAISLAMKEEIFVELADACLKVVENEK